MQTCRNKYILYGFDVCAVCTVIIIALFLYCYIYFCIRFWIMTDPSFMDFAY